MDQTRFGARKQALFFRVIQPMKQHLSQLGVGIGLTFP